jgi:hypothetical protein
LTPCQKGLAVALVAVAMVFEEALTVPGQCDRILARARHSDGLDESLFVEVPQVA